MTRYRFVHAADLHLDAPFVGVGRVAPEVAERLVDASVEALDVLVDVAIEREALFVLFAGGLCDGAAAGLRAQGRLLAACERLVAQGIAVLAATGGRDPQPGEWAAVPRWPDGVTLFGADRVGSVAVERDGERLATVHGRSASPVASREPAAAGFARGPEPGLHVGLLHAAIDGEAGPCPTTSIEELRRAGLDYWALGHGRERRVLAERSPWVVVPGPLQARRPDEPGPRGATVVEVEGGRIAGADFVPCDRVRFARAPLEVAAVADRAGLRAALERIGRDVRREHGEVGLVLRVELAGRRTPGGELWRPGLLDEVLAELRLRDAAAKPFLWWAPFADATRAAVDREAVARRGDFAAECVRLAREAAADPDRGRRLRAAAWPEAAGRDLPPELAAVSPAAAAALLDEAEDLILERLDGAEPRS